MPNRSKLTKDEQKSRDREIAEAKEATFHLVTKVISWKTRAHDSVSMQTREKISHAEWEKYEKHLLDISKTDDVRGVKEKLRSIFTAIESNQGFE